MYGARAPALRTPLVHNSILIARARWACEAAPSHARLPRAILRSGHPICSQGARRPRSARAHARICACVRARRAGRWLQRHARWPAAVLPRTPHLRGAPQRAVRAGARASCEAAALKAACAAVVSSLRPLACLPASSASSAHARAAALLLRMHADGWRRAPLLPAVLQVRPAQGSARAARCMQRCMRVHAKRGLACASAVRGWMGGACTQRIWQGQGPHHLLYARVSGRRSAWHGMACPAASHALPLGVC